MVLTIEALEVLTKTSDMIKPKLTKNKTNKIIILPNLSAEKKTDNIE